MKRIPRRAGVFLLVAIGLFVAVHESSAGPVPGPPITIKRFTGILSGSGPVYQSPGQALSQTATWVDFICDPLSLNWKIQVIHIGRSGPTLYLNNPRICDHVEILMLYYNPQISFPEIGPVDGTAIYIKKI